MHLALYFVFIGINHLWGPCTNAKIDWSLSGSLLFFLVSIEFGIISNIPRVNLQCASSIFCFMSNILHIFVLSWHLVCCMLFILATFVCKNPSCHPLLSFSALVIWACSCIPSLILAYDIWILPSCASSNASSLECPPTFSFSSDRFISSN